MNAPGERVDAKFTAETISEVRRWTETLFSFRTTRYQGFDFVAGQWARLGLAETVGGETVWRPYSMVSGPADPYLEFISVTVPGGQFTTRLAKLREGDQILIDKTSFGFLTLDRFVGGCDLWMLASGTGLGPFLSILREPETWARFANLVLVHSVRRAAELAYRETIEAWSRHPPAADAARLVYLPLVTREPCSGALSARMTTLIGDGRLESTAGLSFDPERSRVMACGNPEMVAEVREHLAARGLRPSRTSQPGQMAFENYW